MKNSIFKKPLKILFAAAEVYPYATVGGLGMVVFSLTRALKRMGVDCRIFIPKYGSIDEKKYKTQIVFVGIINFQLRNKENLIPVTIPTFSKREVVFSKT